MKYIGKRIKELMLHERINIRQFTIKIGVNYGSFYKILRLKQFPSYKLLMRLKMVYPELNMDWLISGEGEMFLPLKKRKKKENK